MSLQRLTVRMYRPGLGDCFLLTADYGAEVKHILIDCGVFLGTENESQRMRDVAADILTTSQEVLEVVIATHQHWDHLSGFIHAEPIFKNATYRNVWLAWTEDPDDELAAELREKQQQSLHALRVASKSLGDARAQRLNAVLDFFGADGVDNTQDALDKIVERAEATRYCLPGETIEPSELPGLRFYVLGPPHTAKQVKRSRPTKKEKETGVVYNLEGPLTLAESFLAGFAKPSDTGSSLTGEEELAELSFPIDRKFRIGLDKESEDVAAEAVRRQYLDKKLEWRSIDDDWFGVAEMLALQLDSATNNTSLAMAIEIVESGEVLLFPGDAQVGNWTSWTDHSWQTSDGEVLIEDLLARTVLYKVGHHGSHNATLRSEGLLKMTHPRLAAMIPVDRVMADKKGWEMPYPDLYLDLQAQTRGRIIELDRGIPATKPGGIGSTEWSRFKNSIRFSEQERLWVEYEVGGS